MNGLSGFWTRRVSGPVLGLLRQGLTPEGIALALAFGLAAGVFPLLGTTTLLGVAIAAVLRLNQPALQLANWLAYPLQLVLIQPFVRLGEWLAGVPPTPFSVAEVARSVAADPTQAVAAFGMVGLHAVLGWLAVVPIVVLLLYRVLLPVLREARLVHAPAVR
jgi:uncharacterized protein (DUF2062 family)